MTNLLSARIENFKIIGLVELKFDPAGGVFSIMGENGAGKSSIIDALEVALAGKAGPKFAQAIKDGEKKSRIILEFDDLVVTREFTPSGTSIDVRTKNGIKQDATLVLSRLYSKVAIDPFAFSQMSEKEQVDLLLKVIGYDPEQDDAAIKAKTQERLEKGRERDLLKGKVSAFVLPEESDEPAVSVVELTVKLQEANEHNATLDAFKNAIASRSGLINLDQAKIVELEASLKEVRERVAVRSLAQESDEAKIAGVEYKPTDELLAKIAGSEKAQADAALRARYAETNAEYEAAVKDYDALTEKIASIVEAKRKLLAAAPMPVDGLTINAETNVLELDGTPFSQASSGIQIRTGFQIALSRNPELKLMTIRDGSLLDKSNNKLINDLALEHGLTVIMETVDESQPAGVRLVAGEVVETRAV